MLNENLIVYLIIETRSGIKVFKGTKKKVYKVADSFVETGKLYLTFNNNKAIYLNINDIFGFEVKCEVSLHNEAVIYDLESMENENEIK